MTMITIIQYSTVIPQRPIQRGFGRSVLCARSYAGFRCSRRSSPVVRPKRLRGRADFRPKHRGRSVRSLFRFQHGPVQRQQATRRNARDGHGSGTAGKISETAAGRRRIAGRRVWFSPPGRHRVTHDDKLPCLGGRRNSPGDRCRTCVPAVNISSDLPVSS